MITRIINKDNLKETEINNTITRVKALIINSKGQILLGHSYCEYQFPGGHVEGDEDLNLALQRELKEEVGLDYDTKGLKPIAIFTCMRKDYPKKDINTKLVINYYEIIDDRIPDLKNTNYTEEEIDGNYTLRYIPLDIVEDVIKRNVLVCGDGEGIAGEMLDLFSKYLVKIF